MYRRFKSARKKVRNIDVFAISEFAMTVLDCTSSTHETQTGAGRKEQKSSN